MTRIVINRIVEGVNETLGHGTIFAFNGTRFNFVTLELPNKHNQKNISSIPTGIYKCAVIVRPSSGKLAILIKDVPNRRAILLHAGNYYTDILGCILVGEYFKDIDGDNVTDIVNSAPTLETILRHAPEIGEDFEIEIKKTKV